MPISIRQEQDEGSDDSEEEFHNSHSVYTGMPTGSDEGTSKRITYADGEWIGRWVK
jgi:hypothetical protein